MLRENEKGSENDPSILNCRLHMTKDVQNKSNQ